MDGIKFRPFYHLPPTAVSLELGDFRAAFQAAFRPEEAQRAFISALSKHSGASNCVLTGSGRSALLLILLSIKSSSSKNKVILPAYSCPTVAQTVLHAGLQPVFCDVSTDTLDLEREDLSRLVDNQTLAIVPTHLYGLAQDISDLVKLGKETGIIIIEDAAQAFGAAFKGKPVGTRGDFGFFSMGRGKCIPTGHGGVIFSQKAFADGLEKQMGALSNMPGRGLSSLAGYAAYGLATTPLGWWFVYRSPLNPAAAGMDVSKLPPIKPKRLSAVEAGIGTSILHRIDRIQAVQRQNAHLLMEITAEYPEIKTPQVLAESKPAFLRFPIVLDNKTRADALYRLLSAAGIGVSRSYTRTLPEMFDKNGKDPAKRYPGAEHLADCLLTLPTHRLRDFDLTRMKAALHSLFLE